MTELVEVDQSDWDHVLASLRCDDAYLVRAYVESAAVLEPGAPTLLHLSTHGGDIVFALLRRAIAGDTRCDVTTPYGYGGPVATGANPPVEDFWRRYGEWCSETGVVSTFFRFHPLFANEGLAPESVHVESIGPTVGWRLDQPDLFKGIHASHRTACRKARKEGVSVDARAGPGDLSGFSALHDETMRRVGATDFYFFGPEYYEALAALGERLVLFDAVADGDLVASALCFGSPPWLHYHLSATTEAGRAHGAGSLVLFEAAAWARERGFERFHLGGGAGGRADSLLSFKRRFDPEGLLHYSVGKVVHDAEAYAQLAGAHRVELDGFFPAYRAG